MRFRRITFVQAPVPRRATVNEQLQWLGGSIGLFNPRDKDRSCFRIFVTLLKNAKQKRDVSSDELAGMTGLTRGTVVHHLNTLMSAGLVEKYKTKYVLRVDTLESLMEKLEQDMQATLKSLRDVAGDIDEKLGL